MRNNRIIAHTLCGAVMMAGITLPARAQTGTVTGTSPAAMTPAPATEQPLAIPMPPGMTVQTEIDLHDDDLLGVFKSLLRGVGQATNTVPADARTTVSNQKGPTDAQIAAILSNADLSDVFKDVTHIHFILLTSPEAPPLATLKKTADVKAKPVVPPTPSLSDQTSFYETAFTNEGGHRIVYSNFDPIHVLMTSFGHAHGFAFMIQAPGTVAVLRADGYPDLSKLSALATSIGAAAGKAALNTPPSKLTK